MKHLILLAGPSGSGKTTWIAQNKKDNWVIIGSDDIRAELLKDADDQTQNKRVFQIAHERAAAAMMEGKVAVLDATNVRERDRQFAIRETGADYVTVILFMTPLKEAQRRNRMRERVVQDEVIERQHKTFIEECCWLTDGHYNEYVVVQSRKE